MGYKQGESIQLNRLKELEFNPKTILDIGAHTGQFYKLAKNIWPETFIWMIEANECHENTLKSITSYNNDKYTIATMGDVEDDYILAWKSRCKGITVYRAGSREKEVLVKGTKEKQLEMDLRVPCCNNPNVVMESGCETCKSCGWSACVIA